MSQFTTYLDQLRAQGDTRSPESVALALGLSLSDQERDDLTKSDQEFAKAFDYAARHLAPPSVGSEVWSALKSGGHQLLGGMAGATEAISQAAFGDLPDGQQSRYAQ